MVHKAHKDYIRQNGTVHQMNHPLPGPFQGDYSDETHAFKVGYTLDALQCTGNVVS